MYNIYIIVFKICVHRFEPKKKLNLERKSLYKENFLRNISISCMNSNSFKHVEIYRSFELFRCRCEIIAQRKV